MPITDRIPWLQGADLTYVKSYNRQVFLVRGREGRFDRVVKILCGNGGPALGFGDALSLIAQSQRYYDALRRLGVRVPPDLVTSACPNGTPERWMVVETASYMGETVHALLETASAEQARELVRGMFDCVRGIFKQDANPRYPIGVDLIPRNFTWLDGLVHCVDLHRAKMFEGGEYLLEWPEPTNPEVRKISIWRHFHPVGLLRVLFIQLCRLRPEMYELFERLTREFAASVGIAPDFAPRIDPAELLGITFGDHYDLRLLACQKAAIGVISRAVLERVFRLTHFQREPIPDERLGEARSLLAE